MLLETGLHKFLSADPALAAWVGSRIFPITYPQDAALPTVTYQLVSKLPEYTHDGEGGVAESHFHVSCFGKTYLEAKETARRVRGALRTLMAQPGKMGDVNVGGVFLENEIDVFSPDEAESLSAYHVLAEYMILAEEEN